MYHYDEETRLFVNDETGIQVYIGSRGPADGYDPFIILNYRLGDIEYPFEIYKPYIYVGNIDAAERAVGDKIQKLKYHPVYVICKTLLDFPELPNVNLHIMRKGRSVAWVGWKAIVKAILPDADPESTTDRERIVAALIADIENYFSVWNAGREINYSVVVIDRPLPVSTLNQIMIDTYASLSSSVGGA